MTQRAADGDALRWSAECEQPVPERIADGHQQVRRGAAPPLSPARVSAEVPFRERRVLDSDQQRPREGAPKPCEHDFFPRLVFKRIKQGTRSEPPARKGTRQAFVKRGSDEPWGGELATHGLPQQTSNIDPGDRESTRDRKRKRQEPRIGAK